MALDESEAPDEFGEDEVVSEGQRWASEEFTQRIARQAREQALKELAALLSQAGVSTDPNIARAHGRYEQAKSIVLVFAKAKNKDAKSGLP